MKVTGIILSLILSAAQAPAFADDLLDFTPLTKILSTNLLPSGSDNEKILPTLVMPEVKYLDIITRLAIRNNIDRNFVLAIITQESRFDAEAQSPKNAQGLMQVLPGTARGEGWSGPKRIKVLTGKRRPSYIYRHISDLKEPEVNITYGIAYLKTLFLTFAPNMNPGSLTVKDFEKPEIKRVISAYNAGKAHVEAYVLNPAAFNKEHKKRKLPASYDPVVVPFEETQIYVVKVTGYFKYYETTPAYAKL